MRILHINASLMAGGAERLVIDICNELDKNNAEVKLLLLSNRIDFDDKTIKFDYSVISSLRLSLKSSNQADLLSLKRKLVNFNRILFTHLFEAELVSRWKVFPNNLCHALPR